MDSLPDELLAAIFSLLPCTDLAWIAPLVSRRWHCIATDRSAVRTVPCFGGQRPHKARCDAAAFMGHLDCMRFLRAKGHPWSKHTCALAAAAGRLNVLKYLHENGCRWDASTCREAAFRGHLNCLEYACENGCPCDKSVFRAAGFGDDPRNLDDAHDSLCVFSVGTLRAASGVGDAGCLEYLLSRGLSMSKHMSDYHLALDCVSNGSVGTRPRCRIYCMRIWNHDRNSHCDDDQYHLHLDEQEAIEWMLDVEMRLILDFSCTYGILLNVDSRTDLDQNVFLDALYRATGTDGHGTYDAYLRLSRQERRRLADIYDDKMGARGWLHATARSCQDDPDRVEDIIGNQSLEGTFAVFGDTE